jgi:L-fucose/D-arabinose isomerase
MYLYNDLKPKVGLISLTDPPRSVAMGDDLEKAMTKKHKAFKEYLIKNEVEVVDAAEFVPSMAGRICFNSSEDIKKAVDIFNQNHIEAVILGCWHWTEPMFVVEIARALNKPILLYSDEDPEWNGVCLLTAAGASLWETSPNHYSQVHERFYGDQDSALKWIKGVCALEKLKESNFLLWGGTYALRMEYLQDDYPKLKSFLVGDILIEGEYLLIKGAEKIEKQRIDNFIKWLKNGNSKICFNEKTFTEEVLKKQIAIYFSAKDRIKALNKKIAGVSVKCFDEFAEFYGVDPCFLPAFIPYTEDSEGPKRAINTVCEGDLKCLITMVLLSNISGGTPSLFGDIISIAKDYLVISNCGASSIYYSCLSCKTNEALKNITLKANSEGVSGAGVSYYCPPNEMTVARLVRSKGKYFMHIGLGKSIRITEEMGTRFKYTDPWPHTAISLNVDQQLLTQSLGANHLVAIPGNYVKELSYACLNAGIEVFRIDSNSGLNNWLERVRALKI